MAFSEAGWIRSYPGWYRYCRKFLQKVSAPGEYGKYYANLGDSSVEFIYKLLAPQVDAMKIRPENEKDPKVPTFDFGDSINIFEYTAENQKPPVEDRLEAIMHNEHLKNEDSLFPYCVRLTAEYSELCDRIDKLSAFIDNYNRTKTPKLTCPVELLIQQLAAMQTYATILKQRLAYEGITD